MVLGPRGPPIMTQNGGTSYRAAAGAGDDPGTAMAAPASNAAADIRTARASFIQPVSPRLAPVARPGRRRRRGRDLAVIVDVLDAVAVQSRRSLQACLIVGIPAVLRRGAALGSAAPRDAERRYVAGGKHRRGCHRE